MQFVASISSPWTATNFILPRHLLGRAVKYEYRSHTLQKKDYQYKEIFATYNIWKHEHIIQNQDFGRRSNPSLKKQTDAGWCQSPDFMEETKYSPRKNGLVLIRMCQVICCLLMLMMHSSRDKYNLHLPAYYTINLILLYTHSGPESSTHCRLRKHVH